MPYLVILIIILALLSAALVAVVTLRPGTTATQGGRILAFIVLFLFPLFTLGMGVSAEIERSKSTKFCLSCHLMEPFGQSLKVDDPTYLAAAHFQNHRVSADEACYTCHTNYAMFGTFKAKLAGLRHVYVFYLTTPPAPEAIRLSEPFNNRECLHCHLGARSFEQGATHNADPETLPAVKANKLSCISSGCHETVHNIAHLKEQKMWNGGN